MRSFGIVLLTLVVILLTAFSGFSIYFAVENWDTVKPGLEQMIDGDKVDAEVPGDTEQPGTGEEPGGTEDPEQPGGNVDDEPETPDEGAIIEDFIFANGIALRYTGDEDISTVEIPQSYSLSAPRTVTIELNNEVEPIEQTLDEAGYYMLKLEFGQELKFNLKDGSSVLVNGIEDWTPETMDNLYMNAVSCEVQEYDYLVGDDIQVYALGPSLFANSNMTTYVCPDYITEIYPHCFEACWSLESIDLSNLSIEAISASMFKDCFDLETVILPTTIQSIDDMAFIGCSKLNSLDLSETNVETIGIEAFRGCSSLTSVYLPNNVVTIGNDAFRYSNPTIYVPAELLDTYQSTYDNYTFAAIEA